MAREVIFYGMPNAENDPMIDTYHSYSKLDQLPKGELERLAMLDSLGVRDISIKTFDHDDNDMGWTE